MKGPHALAFLQKITSNNVAALAPGKIQYTCFPNEEGGIVDDLLVYQYEPEKYMLVVNAANMEKETKTGTGVFLTIRRGPSWKTLRTT